MDRELLNEMAELLVKADLKLAWDGYKSSDPLREQIDKALTKYDAEAKRYARRVG